MNVAPAAPPCTRPHAEAAARELDWLGAVIEARLRGHFRPEVAPDLPPAPEAPGPETALGALIREAGLDARARLLLALALAPHLRPALLDPFFVRNSALDRPFTEFGGQIPAQTGGFLPTGETALFVIAGTDPVARAEAAALLDPGHALRRLGVLRLERPAPGAPPLSGLLALGPDEIRRLARGAAGAPELPEDFPAHRLSTRLVWEDLVLAPEVLDQIDHIAAWVSHESRILGDWGLGRALAPGYRALFHGPPGTGKTLTASLLGQKTGRDVYRVDLSMIVSKYIGETEKNLAGVFDQAARHGWILFFDEADALFGTRTATSSSNDRYANQEIAYLLQRIEDCPCLVILATNLRGNMDDAFSRRFQSLVGFTKPDAGERERLWRGVLSGGVPLAADVSPGTLARDHELAGGAIVNVVRYAAVNALRRGSGTIAHSDLMAGIACEARKEGRTP